MSCLTDISVSCSLSLRGCHCAMPIRAIRFRCHLLWAPGSLGFTSACVAIGASVTCLFCVGEAVALYLAWGVDVGSGACGGTAAWSGSVYSTTYSCDTVIICCCRVVRSAMWLFQRYSIGVCVCFWYILHFSQPQYVPHAFDYLAWSC